MSIKITSEVSKQYLLTDDAVEGFKLAVQNGQTRLALQVLVDVIDGIMEIFDYAMEESTEDVPTFSEVVDVPVEVSDKFEEKKTSPKKTTTEVKEETKKTAE